MKTPTVPIAGATEVWSEWLLNQRYANDPAYQLVVRSRIERIRDRALDAAKLQPGMTIVDVGTGDGLIAFGAITRVGDSLHAYLTDISAPLLKHAKSLANELGVASQCTFLERTAESLCDIADAQIDIVMTRAVLAYVPNKPAALQEFHRVLKPGGRISLAEPIFRDQAIETIALTKHFKDGSGLPSKDFLRLLQKWKSNQFPSTEDEMARTPIANFSERDLVRFAREAGFTDIHLELHIDVFPSSVVTWDVFLGISPHPLAPPLKEIMASQFTPEERALFEHVMRPLVESGKTFDNDAIAYLTAMKPGG
jgi:arsenite methyltransferase